MAPKCFMLGLAALLNAAALPAAPAANGDMAAFPWVKRVEVRDTAAHAVASFIVDEEVLGETCEGLGNMRLYDVKGHEVAYALRSVKTDRVTTGEVQVAMTVLSFERGQSGRLDILLERKDEGPAPSVLQLVTERKDFEARVSVYGSADCVLWVPLFEDRAFFDYSRQINLRGDRFEFAPAAHRYYKVSLSNLDRSNDVALVSVLREKIDGDVVRQIESFSVAQEGFKIDEVRFFRKEARATASELKLKEYTVRSFTQSNDVPGRSTVCRGELSGAPVRAVTLLTPDENFIRKVRVDGLVEAPGAGGVPAWEPLGHGTVSRLRLGGVSQDCVPVSFHASRRVWALRVTIENLDSQPLVVTGLKAEGEALECLFLREDGGDLYRLAYGGAPQAAPRYDIAPAVVEKAGQATDLFLLDEKRSNSMHLPPVPPRGPARGSMLKWALGLTALVLIGMIVAALRRIEPVTADAGDTKPSDDPKG